MRAEVSCVLAGLTSGTGVGFGADSHQSLPQVQERATGTGARESWFTAALNQPGQATARQLLFPPDELVQVQRLVEPQLA